MNAEISPKLLPSKPVPANILQRKIVYLCSNRRFRVSKLLSIQNLKTQEIYIDVTREPVQEIPSQLLPQGSDPAQFVGKLFQSDLIAYKVATAWEVKGGFRVNAQLHEIVSKAHKIVNWQLQSIQ